MNYHVNRECLAALAACVCVLAAAAEAHVDTLPKAYQDFLTINKTYSERGESVLVKQVIRNQDISGAAADTIAYCLFHKNGQCVQMQTKSGVQYFFSAAQGYWLFTDKLKKPLKISGAYKIEEFEIQDILKLDFQTEYQVLENNNGTLLLERTSSKPAYPYIFFTKTESEVFELTFTDIKKRPVRKLVYRYGMVNGVGCFAEIMVYNLIFPQEAVRSWVTEWIKPADIPAALFTYTQIPVLAKKMKQLIK